MISAGVLALSLFSFTGCSTKSMLDHQLKTEPQNTITFVDRGNGVFFVPTTEGVEASRTFSEILKQNPGKQIQHIERTGSYNSIGDAGAGFIIIVGAE